MQRGEKKKKKKYKNVKEKKKLEIDKRIKKRQVKVAQTKKGTGEEREEGRYR